MVCIRSRVILALGGYDVHEQDVLVVLHARSSALSSASAERMKLDGQGEVVRSADVRE
jgi:hypothetical protein